MKMISGELYKKFERLLKTKRWNIFEGPEVMYWLCRYGLSFQEGLQILDDVMETINLYPEKKWNEVLEIMIAYQFGMNNAMKFRKEFRMVKYMVNLLCTKEK